MNNNANDQQIMENILLTTKGACDLYMHGAIESNTQNVHQAFDGALGESLDMQARVYQMMADKGWYPSQQADAQQIARFGRNSPTEHKKRTRRFTVGFAFVCALKIRFPQPCADPPPCPCAPTAGRYRCGRSGRTRRSGGRSGGADPAS